MSEKMMDVERARIVDAMCMTWRHDFGLDKEGRHCLSSGMLADEREALRRHMGQVFDHCVAPLLEARASLPVGVTDREWILHMLADKWPDDGEMVEVEFFRNWLDEVLDTPAAPTVKAEQVQCATPSGNACPGDGVGACKACHSLPAAGLAVEEVGVVGYRIYWPAVGMEPAKARTVDPTEYESKKPVFHTCVEPLMTVAQHNRIDGQRLAEIERIGAELRAVVGVLDAVQGQFNRYGERFPDGFDSRVFRWVDDAVAGHALSAQQSAPERVSVPVELLKRALGGSSSSQFARSELRALLSGAREGGV